MAKEDTTITFLVASVKRAVAVMALKEGGIPVPHGLVARYNTLWVNGGPFVFG